jgi:5-methyltetrahydropteroyltriglutamate--homocysteine methyltransferase
MSPSGAASASRNMVQEASLSARPPGYDFDNVINRMEEARVHTATQNQLLPTTVTGSWPRPRWFDKSLWGRRLSDAMKDVDYREKFLDAVATVLSDQEQAGLDILTNGDFHLDEDLGGLSWLLFPAERMVGVSREECYATSEEWTYRPGSILNEVMGGWRYPAVVEKLSRGQSWEFAKIWRVAQAKTSRPVKFGTVSAQVLASMIEVKTDKYKADKRELIWDMSVALNEELLELAAAGCKVIQIEDPLVHLAATTKAYKDHLDFLVDAYNREVQGLENVEVWIHTCWGNPNMQRVLDDTSYSPTFETYMERMHGDVWTLEMKERNYTDLELFQRYKGRKWPKKVALGVISHRYLQVETPQEVAADIRKALQFIDPDQIVLSTDCGFGRQGCNRMVAFHKAVSMVEGANIVRAELGGKPQAVRAADPRLQIDLSRENVRRASSM